MRFYDDDLSDVVEYLDRRLLFPSVIRSMFLAAAEFVVVAGRFRHEPQANIHAKRSLDHPPIPSITITNLSSKASPDDIAARLAAAGIRRVKVEQGGLWSKSIRVEIGCRPRTDARQLVEIAVTALRALGVESVDYGWRYYAGSSD